MTTCKEIAVDDKNYVLEPYNPIIGLVVLHDLQFGRMSELFSA